MYHAVSGVTPMSRSTSRAAIPFFAVVMSTITVSQSDSDDVRAVEDCPGQDRVLLAALGALPDTPNRL